MAEPIKTTIQEAFDHIKSWIAEGSKDKAIQGLNEILNFDPTNAEAQKLLLEVKTGEVAAAAPISAPAAPVPAPAPEPMPVAVSAPMPEPKPAPMPPPPMPPIKPIEMPQPSAAMPPKAVPMAPSTPEGATKIVGIMKNMKLIIAIGGVVIAIIAGYIFYKNVFSSVDVIKSDIKSVQDTQAQVLENTTPATTDATSVTPDTTAPATSDATIPATPDATPPTIVVPTPATATTPVVSDPSKVEATTGKVKRK